MKKLLPVLLLSMLCASTASVKAFPGFCSPCVHVHHSSSDDWAGPMAVGAIMGAGLGIAATSASRDHATHYSRSMISDLEDQNDILRAKVNSLREKCSELREKVEALQDTNEGLREENEGLRREIKRLNHCGGKLMIKVDAGA